MCDYLKAQTNRNLKKRKIKQEDEIQYVEDKHTN